MKEMPDSTPLVVGKPIASDVSDAEMRAHESEVMGGMLFGMACECWFKGLILMATPRKSRAREKRLNDWVGEQTRGSPELRTRLIRALEVFDTQAYQRRRLANDAVRQSEDADRVRSIRKAGGHDLVKLSEKAKMVSYFAKQDVEFLQLLTKANQLGRYPAPSSCGRACAMGRGVGRNGAKRKDLRGYSQALFGSRGKGISEKCPGEL